MEKLVFDFWTIVTVAVTLVGAIVLAALTYRIVKELRPALEDLRTYAYLAFLSIVLYFAVRTITEHEWIGIVLGIAIWAGYVLSALVRLSKGWPNDADPYATFEDIPRPQSYTVTGSPGTEKFVPTRSKRV